MGKMIYEMQIRFENDIVLARQRARQIAGFLGFEVQDWTRIATAASEVTRNALNYAGGGKAAFLVEGKPPAQTFQVRISDDGPGIPDLSDILRGRYISKKGMGMGLIGAKRLMDQFQIESSPERGTTVLLGKALPPGAPSVTKEEVARIAGELDQQEPQSAFEEIQKQNQELLRLLEQVRKQYAGQAELVRERAVGEVEAVFTGGRTIRLLETPHEEFFYFFPTPDLARELFNLVETRRVECRLGAKYHGLDADFRVLNRRLLDSRKPANRLPCNGRRRRWSC